MLIKLRKKMAQSTLEYVVLAVVVIGALLSIQAYLRRGIAGKIKSSTDDISAEQYDPDSTVYSKNTTTTGTTRDATSNTGSTSVLQSDEATTVNANSVTED
ncbi:MAG: hypothetical protein WCX16_01855 [Candidatus Omnitrophota bacterium]